MTGRSATESERKLITEQIFKRYKKGRRKMKSVVLVTQIVILIGFVAFWEIAGRMRWIDVLLFSYPSKVVSLIWTKLADGTLYPHIWATLLETAIGFILGTIFGTSLATLIWWSPFLARVLDPFIVVMNSMPKVALGPLFIVGFGPGILSIIATTLAVTVIITTLVVYGSFKETDPNYIKVIRVFGGNKAKVFRYVILPSSMSTIVSTLKVNVGLSWVGVIVGEFLVAQQGLGYLIIYGFQVFNFTLVISSLFIIACAATLMYQGVAYIEEKVSRR